RQEVFHSVCGAIHMAGIAAPIADRASSRVRSCVDPAFCRKTRSPWLARVFGNRADYPSAAEISARNGKPERRAASGRIVHTYLAAVRLDNLLGDGQTETGAAAGFARDADKLLEHLSAVRRRNAFARIGNFDAHHAIVCLGAQFDRAARRGMANGVAEQ